MSTYCVLGIILALERLSGSLHSSAETEQTKYGNPVSIREMELSCGAQRKNVVTTIR